MKAPIRQLNDFEFLIANFDSAMRREYVLDTLPPEMQDLTQGGCLALAQALTEQSHRAFTGEHKHAWLSNAQIAVVRANGVAQHFTTQFNLSKMPLYACGYGVNQDFMLKQKLSRDMHMATDVAKISIEPVTAKHAQYIASQAEIPVPTRDQQMELSKRLYHALLNAPRKALYLVSDAPLFDTHEIAPDAKPYTAETKAAKAIAREQRKEAASGITPDEQTPKYIITLGIPEGSDITLNYDKDGMLESASNLSQAVHLGGYELSPQGGVQKMTASDFALLSEEQGADNLFLEAQAMTR